jgi:type I restriction enzyme, S subunit
VSYPIARLETLAASKPYALIGAPFGSKLTSAAYVDEGIPVIRGSTLNGGRYLDENDFVYVSEQKMREDLFGNLAHRGDVVFTQRGTLGQVALIPNDSRFDTYVISQSQMKLSIDPQKGDARFIYYYFSSPEAAQKIINQNSSSGVPHINLTVLRNFLVPVPRLPEQQRIADILSVYDDLIENNWRRIALLEEAARLLYREWFVHFRFPGHEHVGISDGLPEGWKIAGIEEAYEGLFDGPHATPAPSDEGPVFLGIQNIRETGGLDLSSIRHVSEADFPRWTRRVTPREGDIVFSYEATLNRYALIPRGLRCCLGRRLALIRPKEAYRVFLFLHMFSDDWRRVIAGRVLVGATVDRIPLTSFPGFPILIPPRKVAVAFGETVESQFKLIDTLVEQNQKLIQARDLLLPRLMNGEIAV